MIQPRVEADPAAPGPAAVPDAAPGYILLVEDNPGDARLTRHLLDDVSAGTQSMPPMRWVQTVEAAIDTLDARPGCVAVLLDLGLPDGQGMEALHAVTRYDDQVPVIVLTGDDSQPLGMEAVAAGAQDVLVKGRFDAALLRRCMAFSVHRKRAEVALLQRSLHDELTQLPRRALLLDRLALALQQCSRGCTSGALLFVDLDRFKQVNDRLGHGAGDAVLRAVADRLADAVRASDTVARLGGDEFVVLLPAVANAEAATAVGHKLLEAIADDINVNGQSLSVTASIGIAMFHDAAQTADQLLAAADLSMYAAKGTGGGQVCLL